MARNIISMREDGRMTFPAKARKALHIEGETDFSYDITEDGILLRPIVTIPREGVWAYTPEHLASVERARNQPAFTVSREELAAVIASDDPRTAAQDLIAKHGHG